MRNTATCPAGKKVFGGGAAVIGEFSQNFHTVIQETSPGTIGGGALDLWLVAVQNNDGAPHTVRISAIRSIAVPRQWKVRSPRTKPAT